jgi:hypothetical protein
MKFIIYQVCSLIVFAADSTNARSMLARSDLTYQGAFDMPIYPVGSPAATTYTYGPLALRRVGGVPRLFSTTTSSASPNQAVYEVAIPTLKTSSPYNTAQVVNQWGDIYHDRAYLYSAGAWTNGRPSSGTAVFGLYWDEADERLYWTFGNIYSDGAARADPSLGYSKLGADGSGKSTAYGPWRFQDSKRHMGGLLAVPSWYARQYTGGRRLAVGYGGYFSILSVGNGSLGPAVAAFSPPSPGTHSPTTSSATDPFAPTLTTTVLLGYGRGTTDAGYRDTDYENRTPCLVVSGTVASATSTTLTISGTPTDGSMPYNVHYFAGHTLEVTDGSGANLQSRLILDYDAPSQTARVATPFSKTPKNTSLYKIYRGGGRGKVAASASSGSTILLISPPNRGASNDANAATNGIYAGFNLYTVAGTGAGQGPIPIVGYTFDAVTTGTGRLKLRSGLSAAVDTTTRYTIDGPQGKGNCTGARSRTITLGPKANTDTNWLVKSNNGFVKMLTGVAAGQERKIVAYNGSTRVATLDLPWNATPSSGDQYILRAAGFATATAYAALGSPTYDAAAPGARGYQGWVDSYSGAVWVDTGTKHGVLFGATWGVGQTWYEASNIYCEGYKHAIQCFDPYDLAAIAAGSKSFSQVDSKWDWLVQFPGITYPIRSDFPPDNTTPTAGHPPAVQSSNSKVAGMVYDPVESKLYVLVPNVDNVGGYVPRVHVYSVD